MENNIEEVIIELQEMMISYDTERHAIMYEMITNEHKSILTEDSELYNKSLKIYNESFKGAIKKLGKIVEKIKMVIASNSKINQYNIVNIDKTMSKIGRDEPLTSSQINSIRSMGIEIESKYDLLIEEVDMLASKHTLKQEYDNDDKKKLFFKDITVNLGGVVNEHLKPLIDPKGLSNREYLDALSSFTLGIKRMTDDIEEWYKSLKYDLFSLETLSKEDRKRNDRLARIITGKEKAMRVEIGRVKLVNNYLRILNKQISELIKVV